MRAVLQRVSRASVRVDGEEVAAIGAGICAFVGVAASDDEAAAKALAGKIRGLRIFPDDDGVMNRSVEQSGGQILVVSQFTLMGDARTGRRPSWIAAAPPEHAAALYERVAASLEEAGIAVARGRFRAHMEVELVNDGPVTILLDTERAF